MEKDVELAGECALDDAFAERRVALTRLYRSLPAYGSADFWTLLEGCQEEGQALPLEVLARVLRDAVAREDKQARRRIFEVIIARLQISNEQWVYHTLTSTRFHAGERDAFAADLYADLCELLLRSLLDNEQHFWEEHFLHCLRFLRKHVYEQFMRREGHWRKLTPGPGHRVPHTLLESLERATWRSEFEEVLEVSDERAERAFLAVEADVATLLSRLPVHLRTIVWLIFWEDVTTKKVGELLDISERTVRNRLHAALALLRRVLEEEQEVIDGASA